MQQRMAGATTSTETRLTLGPMVHTQMDCGGPGHADRVDRLGAADGPVTWTVEGSRLRLTKGERTLVYRAD
jgi:heat shock protein HslJ